MSRSDHRYVQVFVSNYPISACINVPLTKETLDEAEGVSFHRCCRQSERRVGSVRNAVWLWSIQNVSFAYISMKNTALKTQIPQHLQTLSARQGMVIESESPSRTSNNVSNIFRTVGMLMNGPPDWPSPNRSFPSVGQRRLDRFRVHCFDHTGYRHWFMNLVENGLFIETSHRPA